MGPISDWTILIVEDEPDGQEVVMGLLHHHNMRAESVATAEEALDFLSRHPYTGAVIDLMLPGMDGLGLLKAIRSDPGTAGLPCVAITAYHTSIVKKQALDAGFDAYFAKPLDNASFAHELTSIISAVA
jgi:CheY-like chemotaxis protein